MLKYCDKCYKEIDTEQETCPHCNSLLGVPNGAGGYIFRATAITKEVPAFEKAQLICMIPAGRIATEKEIQAFFCRRYNCDQVRYAPPTPLFAKRVSGRLIPIIIPGVGEEVESIPTWRVVSQRGLVDYLSVEKLKEEGIEVVKSGKGWRVPNYKEVGITFDRLLTLVKEGQPAWPY